MEYRVVEKIDGGDCNLLLAIHKGYRVPNMGETITINVSSGSSPSNQLRSPLLYLVTNVNTIYSDVSCTDCVEVEVSPCCK